MRMLTGGVLVLAGSILGAAAMLAYAMGRSQNRTVDGSPAAWAAVMIGAIGLAIIFVEYRRIELPAPPR